jgi:hypothetical protein
MVTNLGLLAESLPLEHWKHPIDAMFTWGLGVIGGLQDVLAQLDLQK